MSDSNPTVQSSNDITKKEISILAKGAGISLIGKFTGRFAILVTQILLARILSKSVYGIYAIGWNWFLLLSIMLTIGLDKSVLYFGVSSLEQGTQYFRGLIFKTWRLAVIFVSLISILIILLSSWIANLYNEPDLQIVLIAVALSLPLAVIIIINVSITKLTKKMEYATIIGEFLIPISNLCIFILLAVLNLRMEAALVALFLAHLIALLYSFKFVKQLYGDILFAKSDTENFNTRVLLSASLPLMLPLSMLITRSDRILIGYFVAATEVATYQAVAQLAFILNTIGGSFVLIMMPIIADYYHSDRKDRLNQLVQVTTKWSLYLSLPVFIAIIMYPSNIIELLFGSTYLNGQTVMIILVLGQLINAGTGPVGAILVMTGQQMFWFKVSAMLLVINLILIVVLTSLSGIVGAAIASSVVTSAMFIIHLWRVKTSLALWPYTKNYVKGILSAILSILVVLGFKQMISFGDLQDLILGSTLITIIFFGSLIVLGLDIEDKILFANASAWLKRKLK